MAADDLVSQVINSHDIDAVCMWYSILSIKTINNIQKIVAF